MKHIRTILTIFSLSLFLTISSSRAVALQEESYGDYPTGKGPISFTSAPESDDEHFVADTGGELDQYLFRTDGDGFIRFNIPITRYYFNSQDSNIEFNGNGFLTATTIDHVVSKHILPDTVTLRLRVWDVDEDATWCPEVDHIFVNGNQIYHNGNQSQLSGADSTWSTPSFQIPIDVLKFPTAKGENGNPPQAVDNEVAVQVDVLECTWEGDPAWAVEVDWGVIEIPSPIRPIIFVHGWTGTTNSFNSFEDWMKTDGIPSAGQVDLRRGIYPIADTAVWLKEGYDGSFDGISDKIAEFGVDKLNIFAHSKGGLVTRMALRDSWVADHTENVITFASPHHGTSVAEKWQWVIEAWCEHLGFSGDDVGRCATATIEFRRDTMRNGFNYLGCTKEWPWSNWENCTPQYLQQPNVTYYSFAANGDEAVKPLSSTTYPWNADAVPFPDNINVNEQFDLASWFEDHSAILNEETVYKCAISYLDSEVYNSSSCPSSNATSSTPLSLLNEDYQIIFTEEGSLAQGGSQTFIASLDGGTMAIFELYSDESLAYTLTDPNGRFIDPSVASTDPNITYISEDNEGLWLYQYQISTPVAGNWQNQLQASNEVNFVVSNQTNSSVQLSSDTDKLTYQPGDLVTLETALSNGTTPYMGVTFTGVVMNPDDSTTSLTFYDDGSHGDTIPNDGIYTAQVIASSTNGYAIITIDAAKDSMKRHSETSIAIASQTAQFQQILNEYPLDTNGNGLYDSLNLSVSVNVIESGQFEFHGTLVDGNGQPVATGSYSTLMAGGSGLPTGLQTIILSFTGSQIYQHAVNGPYTLTNLTIFDVTEYMLEVDSNDNVYTTTAYQINQFEHPLITLGNGSETPIDYDSNGRFDLLQINLDVTVVQPGNYDVNGRLVDPEGKEIVWSASSFYAYYSGTYNLQLEFDGYEIGTHQLDGPYTLRDLSIFNTSDTASVIYDMAYVSQPYLFTEFEGGYFKVYLPSVTDGEQETLPDLLSGIVTYDSTPVSNIELELRFYNGTSWSTYATTATNSNGYYQFGSVPSLGSDQYMYVRWYNSSSNSNWLSYWSCWSIAAGDSSDLYICDFDLKDISLISPSSGSNISLPYTFQWNKRSTLSDDYELNLADLTDYAPYWWSSFGYVDNYEMLSLPTGFFPNEQYAWWMWVYGPDGYGVSYYYHTITFLNSGEIVQNNQWPMNIQLLKEKMEKLFPSNKQR